MTRLFHGNRRRGMVLAGVALALLGGCGVKPAQLVPTHQWGDYSKSCAELQQEVESTITRIDELMTKSHRILSLGLNATEAAELESLRDRHQHLVLVGEEKRCGAAPPPPPPDPEKLRQRMVIPPDK